MATPYKKKEKSTIPLAKAFDFTKLTSTTEKEELLVVMEKFDGVPLKFQKLLDGTVMGLTRGNKPVTSSVDHIVKELEGVLETGQTVVMEVFLPGESFKVSSGSIRRDKPCPELQGMVWDFWDSTTTPAKTPFLERIKRASRLEGITSGKTFKLVESVVIKPNSGALETAKLHLKTTSKTREDLFEGYVVRTASSASEAGTRKWDYQKIVEEPTLDLFIRGFEEAVDKNGFKTGRTGGLLVDYKGQGLCSVGSGKLSFVEREDLFKTQGKELRVGLEGRPTAEYYLLVKPRMATIKYKKDNTYKGIRQGTFQYWRDDKLEESYD